ncbi:MAG TPA: LamG-like jellyroll fold domain-containing protein [Stellaceae bacterium]|jgi:hypothetical protein
MLALPKIPRIQPWKTTAKGLIGCWPLFEGAGPVLHDVSGYGWDGAFQATAASANALPGAVGMPGQNVISLDGRAGYVDLSAALSSYIFNDNPGFSITCWFYPTVIDGNWHTVLIKQDAATTNRQFFLGLNGGFGPPTNGLSLFLSNATASTAAVGTMALSTGRWYFAAITHYGTATPAALGLTVIPAGGAPLPLTTYQPGDFCGVDPDGGVNPVLLGAYYPVADDLFFAGLIGETRLYSRVLAASEILDIYTGTE